MRAPGPDEIHYQMLINLPKNHFKRFYIFSISFGQPVFIPNAGVLATILPIFKHSKDHTEPTNYRPIPLTRPLCKTLERMINKRLIWYLDSNNLNFSHENLVRLETFIRDAFNKKEHVVAVFFD